MGIKRIHSDPCAPHITDIATYKYSARSRMRQWRRRPPNARYQPPSVPIARPWNSYRESCKRSARGLGGTSTWMVVVTQRGICDCRQSLVGLPMRRRTTCSYAAMAAAVGGGIVALPAGTAGDDAQSARASAGTRQLPQRSRVHVAMICGATVRLYECGDACRLHVTAHATCFT